MPVNRMIDMGAGFDSAPFFFGLALRGYAFWGWASRPVGSRLGAT